MKIKTLLSIFLVQYPPVGKIIGIMKLSVFLLFTSLVQLLAVNTNAQKSQVRFDVNTITVGQLINAIDRRERCLEFYRGRKSDGVDQTLEHSKPLYT